MAEQQEILTIQQAIDLAVQHHKEGRLSQAETIYQQILQSDPNQPVALHLLGVRLEDLKTKPEATLRSLCTWMGIEDSPTLYQMTAQGKKWWGDPTSLDYDANKAMAPFDKASIQRPVGSIFSDKDQFVLGTLFYPFSVRFGYREPDQVAFEEDLREIRPLLNEVLDFEKVISEKSKIDLDQFKRSGDYLLLRASFMDRWNVLNEFKDYPHLLSPLKIPVN